MVKQKLQTLTEPFQPVEYTFPLTYDKNKKQRKFRSEWFKSYPWIHYDCKTDSVFCYTCIKADIIGAVNNVEKENMFRIEGFRL